MSGTCLKIELLKGRVTLNAFKKITTDTSLTLPRFRTSNTVNDTLSKDFGAFPAMICLKDLDQGKAIK